MKKIAIIIVLILVIGALFFWYSCMQANQIVTPDQQEIVDTFGYPDRFSISYLPQGEGDDLVLARHETWFYSDHQQAITFIAGSVFDLEEIDEEEGYTYSILKPESFTFDMGYGEVAALLGDKTIEKIDFVPELFIEGEVETYASDHIVFTIEFGHLTYLETLGLGDE